MPATAIEPPKPGDNCPAIGCQPLYVDIHPRVNGQTYTYMGIEPDKLYAPANTIPPLHPSAGDNMVRYRLGNPLGEHPYLPWSPDYHCRMPAPRVGPW